MFQTTEVQSLYVDRKYPKHKCKFIIWNYSWNQIYSKCCTWKLFWKMSDINRRKVKNTSTKLEGEGLKVSTFLLLPILGVFTVKIHVCTIQTIFTT